MSNQVNRVVIVGGGSAGWLTAGIVKSKCRTPIQITLIESPDIATVGVGEGTWPSMRSSLRSMGVSETDFLKECDASFKQGSKFAQWTSLAPTDSYYHPFTLPSKYNDLDLSPIWCLYKDRVSFAHATGVQPYLCDRGLAPKQITTPEYEGIANYGYHLDAGKFGSLLQRHCVENLGVTHIKDTVVSINSTDCGDILSVTTTSNGDIEGDLFVDCTGFASLLLGGHYQIPFVSKKNVLFNDRALAIQVPYSNEDDPILSHTLSTAQSAGWIWDIGLPSRRGVGHVFSSAHISDEEAEVQLRGYIAKSVGEDSANKLSVKRININPGHREIFWHKNCVAVGMAAGFIEPLEASALVLIELAAKMIGEQMPVNRGLMDIVSKKYNQVFAYRWQHVIDFLKLHYVLSKRTDSSYWIDNRAIETISDSLQEQLELWKYRAPWICDELYIQEMFPSASYQFVINGMQCGFEESARPGESVIKRAEEAFSENIKLSEQLTKVLLTNRELLKKINQYGLHKI